MYKHLYDKFKNWYDNNATIYLYSDPHFSDHEMPNIRTNYISDEEQVKRINFKVGKNDTLIILGDVGNVEFVKKLRGHKVLIMGNHDSGSTKYLRERFLVHDGTRCPKCNNSVVFLKDTDNEDAWCNTCKSWVYPKKDTYYDNHLFDEVYEGPLIISEKIILSHEPVNIPYMLNIHGHTHSLPHIYDDNHINVVAEAIDYTPVRLNDIIKSGVLKKIDSIHRETIDKATERKKKRG